MLEHLATILTSLTPVAIPLQYGGYRPTLALTWVTGLLALWGVFQARRVKPLIVLPLFGVLEIGWRTAARATFENRYFVPLLWMTLILLGLGVGHLWDQLRLLGSAARRAGAVAALVVVVASLGLGYQDALYQRAAQTYRNEASLTAIGAWLNQHTAPSATVLLEPLGYVGYYANRHMLDDVGLVTPQIVALKKEGLHTAQVIPILQPEYVVVHCDDALRWLAQDAGQPYRFAAHYQRAAVMNPLAFDAEQPSQPPLARAACYEIWEATPPSESP